MRLWRGRWQEGSEQRTVYYAPLHSRLCTRDWEALSPQYSFQPFIYQRLRLGYRDVSALGVDRPGRSHSGATVRWLANLSLALARDLLVVL